MTNEAITPMPALTFPTPVSGRRRLCNDCGRLVPVEDLLVRIVVWKNYGRGGRSQRVRTECTQCKSCVKRDPVYVQPQGGTRRGKTY